MKRHFSAERARPLLRLEKYAALLFPESLHVQLAEPRGFEDYRYGNFFAGGCALAVTRPTPMEDHKDHIAHFTSTSPSRKLRTQGT